MITDPCLRQTVGPWTPQTILIVRRMSLIRLETVLVIRSLTIQDTDSTVTIIPTTSKCMINIRGRLRSERSSTITIEVLMVDRKREGISLITDLTVNTESKSTETTRDLNTVVAENLKRTFILQLGEAED